MAKVFVFYHQPYRFDIGINAQIYSGFTIHADCKRFHSTTVSQVKRPSLAHGYGSCRNSSQLAVEYLVGGHGVTVGMQLLARC